MTSKKFLMRRLGRKDKTEGTEQHLISTSTSNFNVSQCRVYGIFCLGKANFSHTTQQYLYSKFYCWWDIWFGEWCLRRRQVVIRCWDRWRLEVWSSTLIRLSRCFCHGNAADLLSHLSPCQIGIFWSPVLLYWWLWSLVFQLSFVRNGFINTVRVGILILWQSRRMNNNDSSMETVITL